MSNGDDGEADADASTDGTPEADPDSLEQRLDDVAESLEAAGTESDLDDVESHLQEVASTLAESDLPEPDDEDEDDPAETIQSRIDDLEGELEAQRGPYAEDVASVLEETETTLRETRWTDDGIASLEETVGAFLETAGETLDDTFAVPDDDPSVLADGLYSVVEATEAAGLYPDEDAETIGTLLSAAEEVSDGVEAAESWEDLTVVEQLTEEGFYDVMSSERRKDFPPEWNAVKLHEKRYQKTGDPEAVEYILLALEKLESDFMEENILDSLARIGPPEALDDMLQLAGRRNKQAIDVLGKIGDDEALDTLLDYIDGEGDPSLQIETLRAVSAIGSHDATQTVADRLVADNEDVRSAAARALGRIGDTRAIAPLEDVLADAEEADSVRASAAWALTRIGTERALEAASEYTDDESFLVQAEAEKAVLSS